MSGKLHKCVQCGLKFVYTEEQQVSALKNNKFDEILAANSGMEAIMLVDKRCPECRRKGTEKK